MEATKQQKINNAICTVIAYATKGFMAIMAALFAIIFVVCLVQIFRDPIMSLVGCVASGFCAFMCWSAMQSVETKSK